MISRTCLIFMIAFTVNELRAYIDVRYGGTYPEKNDYNRNNSQSFQVRILNLSSTDRTHKYVSIKVDSEF